MGRLQLQVVCSGPLYIRQKFQKSFHKENTRSEAHGLESKLWFRCKVLSSISTVEQLKLSNFCQKLFKKGIVNSGFWRKEKGSYGTFWKDWVSQVSVSPEGAVGLWEAHVVFSEQGLDYEGVWAHATLWQMSTFGFALGSTHGTEGLWYHKLTSFYLIWTAEIYNVMICITAIHLQKDYSNFGMRERQ